MVDISILLPTRNEAGCIEETMSSIAKNLENERLSYEILVLDDNSKDGTQDAVDSFSRKNRNVRLIRRKPPYGFGISLREGVALAKGELTIVMMADLSDDPAYIKDMWSKFKEGYDVIVGSRFIRGSKVSNYPPVKYLVNRLFNLAVMLFFMTGIRDTSNNFKAFATSKLKKIRLESNGFEIGAEMMLGMLLKGCKAIEIPVSWSDRTSGTAKFRISKTAINYFMLFLRMVRKRILVKR